MTIDYQFGDAHGATIWAQVASLQADHQAIVCDVLAASDFLGRGQRCGLPGVHHCVRA